MGAYESPEAAYWAFFETFNAKSAAGRAAVMSYPHVRASAGQAEPSIQQTAQEFEASASWEQFERAGWARTQPITPRVVHRSPDKIHFAGGWTRLRADGSAIGENRLLYIATKLDQGWGIQGAFGVEGHLTGEDARPAAEAAMAALQREMAILNACDLESWLDCFHHPMVIVFAPGQVASFETRDSTAEAFRDWANDPRSISCDAQVTAAGPSGVLIEQSISIGDDSFQQVSLFVERDGVWASTAISVVRPDG